MRKKKKTYDYTVGAPVRNKFRSISKPLEKEDMEREMKEMIKSTKSKGGAFSEKLEPPEDFEYDKKVFKKNAKTLKSAIDKLEEFQDKYFDYMKKARMAFKLSCPNEDLPEILNVDKENVNYIIADAKGDLDDLVEIEKERTDLIERLKYELDVICWHLDHDGKGKKAEVPLF